MASINVRMLLGNERGSILLSSLLLLAVFTLLGGTFLLLSNTEGRIATNLGKGTQALYVAESGAHAAYREFAASNFRGRTHEADGTIATVDALVPQALQGQLVLDDASDNGLADERNDGWFVWEWNPGDAGASLTGSGLPESFRFSLRPASADVDENEYIIDTIGRVGNFTQRLQVLGYTQPMFNYTLFSDGDLAEFTRGVDQQVFGSIHANGDMYFRPAGTTLTIHSSSVTATGQMIRSHDVWGRPASGTETVRIQGASGIQEMMGGDVGTAMDSNNADWTNDDADDGVDGALELWGGVVRDGALGAVHVDVPPIGVLAAGGMYDENAEIRIQAGDVQRNAAGVDITAWVGDAIREVTFWNPSIDEYVTVQEIDMGMLESLGMYPSNGLIYSEVPLRLTNARRLPRDLTVAANHSIYTKGDYNSQNKRAAAIISAGRVWHVSDSWQDDDTYTMGPKSGRQATNGTTSVNAAIVDGQPVVNEANFADLDGDGSPDDPSAGDTWANCDQLLESWGSSRTLMKRGSIVHLEFANMADNVNNSGIQPDQVAWVKHAAYNAPHRDYGYDQSLAGMIGQPPFSPLSSRLYLWQEITP